MFVKACFLFASAGLFVLGADQRPDAFLDQPLPPGTLPHISDPDVLKNSPGHFPPDFAEYHSYRERLVVLEKIAPRPLILPDGFLDFVAQVERRSNWDKGNGLFLNERSGMGIGPTYRSFFRASFDQMDLTYKYDSKRDALVADFAWRRDDPRSCSELMRVLTDTHPMPANAPGDPASQKNDPWRIALDALLSKPDNFPNAWKIRFVDDARGAIFVPMPGTILWSGLLSDEKKNRHFLVINYHQAMMIPGPCGSFGCYVFDSEGHFEQGAILSGAYRCGDNPKIAPDASGKSLSVSYTGNGWVSGILSLDRDGVVLRDSDPRNSLYLGIPLYRTETILN